MTAHHRRKIVTSAFSSRNKSRQKPLLVAAMSTPLRHSEPLRHRQSWPPVLPHSLRRAS